MGPRGSCEIRSCNGTAALAWKGNKVVHFLSTVHSPDQVSTIQRNQRLWTGGCQLVDVPAHAIIMIIMQIWEEWTETTSLLLSLRIANRCIGTCVK